MHPRGESPRHRARAWLERALPTVLAVWERRGAAYRRHLRAAAQPRDAVDDLLTLGARRVLPLGAPVRRGLPVARLPVLGRALLRLPLADRRVLLQDGAPADLARREHRAAALWRLLAQTQAVRRERSAPLV